MSYPPPLPPDTRENDTPMADNHAGDHNAIVSAIEDVVGVLGGFPQGQYTGSLQDRLAWLGYQPGVALTMSVGAAPNKIVLHCGAVDVLVATDAGVTITGTLNTASLTTGAITSTGITVNGGITATQQITCQARIQGWDLVLTGGGMTLPNNAHLASNVSLVQLGFGSSVAQLSNTGLNVQPAASGVNWNERPLVVQGSNYGAIGLHSMGLAKAGAIQLFTSGVASAGFHFVNTGNSAYLSCHAFKFVEETPPGLLREAVEWTGNGINVVRALRPQVLRSVIDTSTDGQDGIEVTTLGFLPAHVRALLPELVEDDADDAPIGIAYSGFIPVLVDAIRNLDRRLDILERELVVQP